MLTAMLACLVTFLGLLVVLLASWVCHLFGELERATDLIARHIEQTAAANKRLDGITTALERGIDIRA